MKTDKLINEVFKYLESINGYSKMLKTKIKNLCGKCSQNDIPKDIWQSRTPRNNRILISWETIQKNNISIDQLNTIENGVTVEFVNSDIFLPKEYQSELYKKLLSLLNNSGNIRSIISFRTVNGSSSSNEALKYWKKFIQGTTLIVDNKEITIDSNNYSQYFLRIPPKYDKRIDKKRKIPGCKNNVYEGFIYTSIKGGSNTSFCSHEKNKLTLFNSATEYAHSSIQNDIYLVLLYFLLHSINFTSSEKHNEIIKKIEKKLSESYYDNNDYKGNLLDYCKNHYCLKMFNSNVLYDPIQLKPIHFEDFTATYDYSGNAIDLSHNESVKSSKFYWDYSKNVILSPTRPTNLFWSFHLSNMMQQNFTIPEFYENLEKTINIFSSYTKNITTITNFYQKQKRTI